METGIYKHYKGGYYQVLGIAEHTETKERVVVYISLSGAHLPGPRMRVRPLEGPEGFMTPVFFVQENIRARSGHPERELVTHATDAMRVPRFEYVGDEIPQ